MNINCPHCHQTMEVGSSQGGQTVSCPSCGGELVVPQMSGPPLLQQQAPNRIGDDAGIRLLLPVGRSGWAIAAGYLGLFALIIVPAPLALIVSTIAIKDIRKSDGAAVQKHGMGRAIFGLITGFVGTAILGFFLLNL